MKNLKTLNRKALRSVLGGIVGACEPPRDGVCSSGYVFCSNPYCCFSIKRAYFCID